jgi:hypothetical protein
MGRASIAVSRHLRHLLAPRVRKRLAHLNLPPGEVGRPGARWSIVLPLRLTLAASARSPRPEVRSLPPVRCALLCPGRSGSRFVCTSTTKAAARACASRLPSADGAARVPVPFGVERPRRRLGRFQGVGLVDVKQRARPVHEDRPARRDSALSNRLAANAPTSRVICLGDERHATPVRWCPAPAPGVKVSRIPPTCRCQNLAGVASPPAWA